MNGADEESGQLLVHRSSAGSGKTSTLVSSYLELALKGKDPSDYGRILAITFTNKAAREMKERVLSELAALAEGKEVSPPTRKAVQKLGLDDGELKELASRTLTHILHHYSQLSISTIDRFVHRIVQQFARELEVPVDFELVMEEEEVLQRAVDTLIAKAGTSEEALTKALTGFASAKAEDDKSWNIEQDLLDASRTLLEEDGRRVWEQMKEFGPERIIAVRQKLSEERKRFEARIDRIADRGLELIEREGIAPQHFFKGKQGGVPSYLRKLKKKDPSDLAPTQTLLKTLEEDKWTAGKCPSDQADRIQSIAEELRSLLGEAIGIVEREGGQHLFRCMVLQELYRLSLLSGVEDALERIKEDEGLLLISDLDRIIADLILKEPAPFIYERIGDRYDHILFDEFQDTSILQWQNLLPLVENSLAEGNTVMLVGDGKQAIYRWRNGDVEQFLKLPRIHNSEEESSMEDKEELLRAHYQEEQLLENFRSAPIIVDTNNELFPVMNRILMEGAEEAGMEELKALFDEGGQKAQESDEKGYVHFELLPDQNKKEKEEDGDRMLERCLEILQGPLKEVPPSEIAILTRKNAEGARIAGALMEEGIEVLSSESLHLDQSDEVNFLIELYRIIEDPANEIAKLEAVRYLLQHQGRGEELHRWIAPYWITDEKGRNGKIDIRSLWQDMGSLFDPDSARNAPLYRVAEDAIRAFGLDDPASPYLQFFLDHLFRFTERNGDELQAFLEDWDGMRNKPSIKVPNELDAVRVMTIHSAKGLEFPYVIIPGPERNISYSKDRIWVDPDGYIEELPAALIPMNKHLGACPEPYAAEEAKERYRSRLDALNLLYVAMTRAEKGLFVLIQDPPRSSPPSDLLDKSLLTALNECYGEMPEEGLSFGELPGPSKEKEGNKGGTIEHVPHEAWDERVKIRFKAPADPDLEDPEAEREAGELIHDILARTERRTELPNALDELQSEGRMGKKERQRLEERLGQLIERKELAPFFDAAEGQKLLCERDLLMPDGRSIRPDRVLIEGEQAKVLEIKTGSRSPSHHEQLERYRDALREMGYRSEGYLLYTEDEAMIPLEEGERGSPSS